MTAQKKHLWIVNYGVDGFSAKALDHSDHSPYSLGRLDAFDALELGGQLAAAQKLLGAIREEQIGRARPGLQRRFSSGALATWAQAHMPTEPPPAEPKEI